MNRLTTNLLIYIDIYTEYLLHPSTTHYRESIHGQPTTDLPRMDGMPGGGDGMDIPPIEILGTGLKDNDID